MSAESGRKWREANPEKARAAARKWRETNPEKVKEIAYRAKLKRCGVTS